MEEISSAPSYLTFLESEVASVRQETLPIDPLKHVLSTARDHVAAGPGPWLLFISPLPRFNLLLAPNDCPADSLNP